MTWTAVLTEALDATQGSLRISVPLPADARWPYRVVIEPGETNAELAYITGAGADGTYVIERGVLGSDSYPHPVGSTITRSIPMSALGKASGSGTGATGPAGKSILAGEGQPTSNVGEDGDLYIDSATGDLWRR